MTIFINVKVTPNASNNQIIGWKEDLLCLRIHGAPEKGRVNDELITFFADLLDIAKSKIEIISGHTFRLKRLKIEGISQEQFQKIFPKQ